MIVGGRVPPVHSREFLGLFLKPFLVALWEKLLEDFHRNGEIEVGVCFDCFNRHTKLNRRDEAVGEDAAFARKDVMSEENREEYPDLFGENRAAIHPVA